MLAQFNSSPVRNSPCGVWPSFRRSQGCISSGWCHRLVMLHASIHAETDSQLVPASLSPSPSPSLSASLSLSLFVPPGPVPFHLPRFLLLSADRQKAGLVKRQGPGSRRAPIAVTGTLPAVSQWPLDFRSPFPSTPPQTLALPPQTSSRMGALDRGISSDVFAYVYNNDNNL
jgi:hypothetical protein